MCCSAMLYSSIYSEYRTESSGCQVWRQAASSSRWAGPTQTKYPLYPSLYLLPISDSSCPYWQAVETQNPNYSSVHWTPTAPVNLADMKSPFWISADDRNTMVEGRSLFLRFSFSWLRVTPPGTHRPCEEAEVSFHCFCIFNRWPRIRLPSCPLIRWQCTYHPRIYRSSTPRTTL